MQSRLKNLKPREDAAKAAAQEQTSSPQMGLRRLKNKMSQVRMASEDGPSSGRRVPCDAHPTRGATRQVSMRLKGKGQASGDAVVRALCLVLACSLAPSLFSPPVFFSNTFPPPE